MNYGTLSSDYDAGYDDGVATSRADSDALDAIALVLGGQKWDSDTPERIAEIIRRSGRIVLDVDES